MAAPSTNEEYLGLVRRSGFVPPDRLDPWLQKLQSTNKLPAEPKDLAAFLVRDGFLTYFQAEQFLMGKYRGFTLGKYYVIERLGLGGMGIVYLCEHIHMRRRVAVKVLPIDLADDQWALERFYREAQAAAALDHPNIVHAHDIDQEGNLHFIVMEYVEGSSLEKIVRQYGPLSVLRSAHYVSQAAAGLQHAHESNLVHRDIKPANLLLDKEGTVKILDMGLARFFHDQTDTAPADKASKRLLGTADYLSPEQAMDSDVVDIRTDIYSLGATFYFLLTGRPPFDEPSLAQKLMAHQLKQPKSIRELRPEVPAPLEAILLKMMAKAAAQRYQVPTEVIEALRPWTTVPIPPPSEREISKLSQAARNFIVPVLTGTGPGSTAGPASGIIRKKVVADPTGARTETPVPSSAPTTASPRSSVQLAKTVQQLQQEEEQAELDARARASRSNTPPVSTLVAYFGRYRTGTVDVYGW